MHSESGMTRLVDWVSPFWRGVTCTVAVFAFGHLAPRRAALVGDTLGQSITGEPPYAFFKDSSYVVVLAAHEQSALPLLVTGAVDHQAPDGYSLADLGDVIRESLRERAPTLLQARAPGGFLAQGLAGPHTRLDATLERDGRVTMRVTLICPPRPWRHFGPPRGHEQLVHLSSASIGQPPSIPDAFNHAVVAAARAACPDDLGAFPDLASRVTSTVTEVRVAMGQPQALHMAFPLVFYREGYDGPTAGIPASYRIADTTIARLTTLGIEGLRPGATTIEARAWTRSVTGVEGGGAAVVTVPLVITK